MTFTRQLDEMDCGPACLRMIAAHHGRYESLSKLRTACQISRMGVSMLGISHAAEQIGLRTLAVKIRLDGSDEKPGLKQFPMPCIAHWEQKHFVVVYQVSKSHVWVADPAHGKIKNTHQQFNQSWAMDDGQGIILGLEPTAEFYAGADKSKGGSWRYLFTYLADYKKLWVQFILGMLAGLVLQLIFPFLSQALMDVGVQGKDIGFIWLILIGQLTLFVARTAVQAIQAWILMQIGRRVNVRLVADFLTKLLRLPVGFYDSKNIGDLIQRIGDNDRVESFLTGSSINVIFSAVSFVVFSAVLLTYNGLIFGVFLLFSVLYAFWVGIFMKYRRDLDYVFFQQNADNQQNLYETIQGMHEIKLQGSGLKRRAKWLDIQTRLFRAQARSLSLRQWQDTGASSISQIKDILITFIAAMAVVDGKITIGMMMAIQYIVAQLDGPFHEFIGFARAAQDANISLERLAEITDAEEEAVEGVLSELPPKADIKIEDLSFKYNTLDDEVLKGIACEIPHGKVTAIVGLSGSGKTTLLKLLLGFYKPTKGGITVGGVSMNSMDLDWWRSQCGAVMQDGFIFSDSIAGNISESDNYPDFAKLNHSLKVANIQDFVQGLPLGYNTVIGGRGIGVSQGQKQRLLIARAVYRNPEFLFFDEATNALDTYNERVIQENLSEFFANKTVVVVAHRLSTVRNADQIIVLENGQIVETGNHNSLVKQKGRYLQLVENQLEVN